MACGGCGKNRKKAQSKISIYRNDKKLPNSSRNTNWKPNTIKTGNIQTYCPMCKSIMRVMNKYDSSARVIIKKYACPNPSCNNK